MALLVTLFLVLVNIFNSVTANAPKAEGLTAVETWVVMCILHVFCVLSEYAIILKMIQVQKVRAEKVRKSLLRSRSRPGHDRVMSQQHSRASTPVEQQMIFDTVVGTNHNVPMVEHQHRYHQEQVA